MRALLVVFLVFSLGFTVERNVQEPQEQPEPDQQEPAQPVPVEPVRVVGQAQTQEEIDAWNSIGQVATPEEQIRLSEQFLVEHPDSGLTPFAHYNLAGLYRGMDDIDNFIIHGEKALEELPRLPDVLGYLAFFYAEKGNDERAVECAQETIGLLTTMSKPPQFSEADWAVRKFELLGEANYALGRVDLSRAAAEQAESSDPILDEAVGHFLESLKQSPRHPYAAFRLAETYTRKKELENAIDTYGRVVAVGGVIGDFARSRLQAVYQHVHGNTDGMQTVLDREQEKLQQVVAERERMLAEMRAAEERASPESLVQEQEATTAPVELEKPPFM